MTLWAGMEAGGTKFVCAVASGPDTMLAETRFPTTTPDETISRAIAFLREQRAAHGEIAAVGIASFGPVDPNPASPTFGYITTTPKPGWAHVDLAGPVREALGVPVAFDTDVNGAALAEARWGAARGLDTFVYLTVGTGIGGGAMVNGKLLHGLMHPEMGHVFVPHDRARDPFPGICPYHADCLEGLASGPALEARCGRPADTLPPEHPAWELEADYLAHGLVPQIYILSPQRIILGGGVMDQAHLLPRIRERVLRLLNNYIRQPTLMEDIDGFLVSPGLGNRAGVLGAIALAQEATLG
ncbi:MAG TPA: ROK family protein [Candidatus Hydrogenedentes bacterium]|nr:ROK family protein [Candidatus Hydrogenedentota bacterium]